LVLVFANNNGHLWTFLSNAFYGFSGFAKDVTVCNYMPKLSFQGTSYKKILLSLERKPHQPALCLLPYFLLVEVHDKLSLFSNCNGFVMSGETFSKEVTGHNGCKADHEKPKLTSEQEIILIIIMTAN